MFLLLLLGVVAVQGDNTRQVLQSPKLLLQVFGDFEKLNNREYSPLEASFRFRLFRKNLQFIATQNEQALGWESGVNFFADLTEGEKQQYLGLNVSLASGSGSATAGESGVGADDVVDGSVNWIASGHVTPVKNQGSCGSCWSFGSVVSVEGQYKSVGGKLKNFAEQEYLDCVYPTRNGCGGGWHTACFDYSRMYGRLAITQNYPYTATDKQRGYCDLSAVPNGLQSARVHDYNKVAAGEARHLSALAITPTTVAFEVTNAFQIYQKGIIKDRTCNSHVNHAVAAVGYTDKYIIVKNSWGKKWGDGGFVKFGRGWHNCQLNDHVAYPVLTTTDVQDTDTASPVSDYDPEANPGPTPGPDPVPDPDCKDEFENWCQPTPAWCDKPVYFEKLCRKTCNNCWVKPTEDPAPDVCPSGTVRCSDGVCRHEHMC